MPVELNKLNRLTSFFVIIREYHTIQPAYYPCMSRLGIVETLNLQLQTLYRTTENKNLWLECFYFILESIKERLHSYNYDSSLQVGRHYPYCNTGELRLGQLFSGN